MTRFVVIGAGAVGVTLAAELSAAGIQHVLVGRGASARALAADGISYVRGTERLRPSLVVASSPEEVALDEDDVLVLATKTQDADRALAEWSTRPVGDRTAATLPIVTLQNGLDAERSALRRFDRVYGASILTPARFTQPGEVVLGSVPVVGVVTLGRADGGPADDTAEAIAVSLRRASYVVQLTDNVLAWKAAKLLWSVRNGLEVLTGTDEELLGRLVDETQAVLAAAGIALADPVADRTEDVSGFGVVEGAEIAPGQQSTWQSFARHAGTSEVDFLNGEVVLLGRLHGVPTPANAAVQQVLARLLGEGTGPGTRSVSEVLELEQDLTSQRFGREAVVAR